MVDLLFAGLLLIVVLALIASAIAVVLDLSEWCYRLAMSCGVPTSIGLIIIAIWRY